MNVVALKQTKENTSKQPKRSRAMVRKQRQQAIAGVGLSVVALTLCGLSLTHLSHGIEIVTHSAPLEAWAMAIGIDLGFVAAEVANVTAATDKVRKLVEKHTKPTIAGMMLVSAFLNALAFAWNADGYMAVPAACFGLLIPGMIYKLTRAGVAMWTDR